MKKKKFLITIDTEGDNLWNWHEGMPIHTDCVEYLPRFQELCNKFEFKPTWLTNYEVIMDDRYVEFIQKVESSGTGELGMHLHAWSTPPDYKIPVEENGQPYLIEFPEDIMEEKIKTMTELIISRTGIKPVSHRAGRWAMDDRYFRILAKYDYKYDCSVTPHVNWSSALGWTKNFGGTDYSKYPKSAYVTDSGVCEVPVSIRKTVDIVLPEKKKIRSILGAIKRKFTAQPIWIRPNGCNINEMKYLAKKIYEESDSNYLMFMLHSSEMMPGGSPTFKTKASIEKLYCDLNGLFDYVSKMYQGATLREYGKINFQQ